MLFRSKHKSLLNDQSVLNLFITEFNNPMMILDQLTVLHDVEKDSIEIKLDSNLNIKNNSSVYLAKQ